MQAIIDKKNDMNVSFGKEEESKEETESQ